MRIFLTTRSLSILETGEESPTPEWVVPRFLGELAGTNWFMEHARNKRFHAEVTEEERDRLVLVCAWAGDNLFSSRYDGQYSRHGGFGPSYYDVVMAEAKLMWRTADRLARLDSSL